MLGKYFGEPWPSDICDQGHPVETPVGTACLFCMELVVSGDRGWWIPFVRTPATPPVWEPTHLECSLRAVTGGIEHLVAGPHKSGKCYEGSTLSYRDSALAAYAYLHRLGPYGQNVVDEMDHTA